MNSQLNNKLTARKGRRRRDGMYFVGKIKHVHMDFTSCPCLSIYNIYPKIKLAFVVHSLDQNSIISFIKLKIDRKRVVYLALILFSLRKGDTNVTSEISGGRGRAGGCRVREGREGCGGGSSPSGLSPLSFMC